MKTSNVVLQISTFFLLFCISAMPACKDTGELTADTSQIPGTIFKEIIDTVVVYDPEARIETTKIFKYIDTIVNGVPIHKEPQEYELNYIIDTLDISPRSRND